jgi:hypothetical protein
MYIIKETTYEEKMEMYMKLDKETLCAMLIECNRHLEEIEKPSLHWIKPFGEKPSSHWIKPYGKSNVV